MKQEKRRKNCTKYHFNAKKFGVFLCSVLCISAIAVVLLTLEQWVQKKYEADAAVNTVLKVDKAADTDKNNEDLKKDTVSEGKENKTETHPEKTPVPEKTTTEVDVKKEVPPEGKTNDQYAVNTENAYQADGKKTVFLTFDDGPTQNITPQVLDVLGKYNVKATFFVLGKMAEANPEILKREVREGHAIGNHSYSHVYSQIYSSQESLQGEIDRTEQVLKKVLGEHFSTRVFRFPGGSSDAYKQPMKAALKEKGYACIDWNTVNGDEEIKNPSAEWLLNRVKETAGTKEKVVLLMHDSANKQTTLQALPGVIEYFMSRGYEFKTLK